MNLTAYTNADVHTCRALLAQARDAGFNDVERLLEFLDQQAEGDRRLPQLADRSMPRPGDGPPPEPPPIPICPSCDRGAPMVRVYREGIRYLACRACRYSKLED